MEGDPKVDLYFEVRGHEIPIDHGYLLYGAISRIIEDPSEPWLHESDSIGIHLIRGRYLGRGRLALTTSSRIGIRAPADQIHRLLPLTGKQLALGDMTIQVGPPQSRPLSPAPNLYAHLVTTRNGQDEARFDEEICRQLAALDVRGRPHRGPRHIFRVKEKRIVAHSLVVTELTAEESIRLQEVGLGGRRKLGCGVFLPWQAK